MEGLLFIDKREFGIVTSRTVILKNGLILLYGILNGWKKFAALLPNNWLAETPRRLRRGGLADSRRKGCGFLKSTETFFNKKTAGKLAFYEFVYSLKAPIDSEGLPLPAILFTSQSECFSCFCNVFQTIRNDFLRAIRILIMSFNNHFFWIFDAP